MPFPRALELAVQTGAQVVAGLPLEPVVLGAIARARGLDPARDMPVDALFLGGAPLPPALQGRLARDWGARVIELYGSTETMLLGTSCAAGTLHLETALAYCEVLDLERGEPVPDGCEGELVVTTLGIEGSPLFFAVLLPDRVLVRIEGQARVGDPVAAFRGRLPDLPVEIEEVAAGDLLDVEMLSRSPHVYKPVVLSDWRRPGRRILTVIEGMMEWPRPGWAEGRRWLARTLRTARRRRRLVRELRLAARSPRCQPGRVRWPTLHNGWCSTL